MNEMNSITGLLPRKVNISFFKKRNENSTIEEIKKEIESKLANDYTGLENRIKIILGIQAKYSDKIVISELINLCRDFILDEIKAFEVPQSVDHEAPEVELIETVIEKKRLWVKYCVRDSNGWWTDWKSVKFWEFRGYGEEYEEELCQNQ